MIAKLSLFVMVNMQHYVMSLCGRANHSGLVSGLDKLKVSKYGNQRVSYHLPKLMILVLAHHLLILDYCKLPMVHKFAL